MVNVDIAVHSLSKSLYRVALTLTPKHRAANYATDHENNSLLHREDLQCSIETWESLRHVVTFLKNETTKKERHSWNTLKKEKNSKALWNKISWRGTFGHIPGKNKQTLNGLSEHFQKKGEFDAEKSTLLSDVTGNQHVDVLGQEISLDEIETARQSLKQDKATSDGWSKGTLTNIPLCIMYAIKMIFNTLLLFHIYPTKWRTTTVNEIFKNKGDTRYAKYYRPISLKHLW